MDLVVSRSIFKKPKFLKEFCPGFLTLVRKPGAKFEYFRSNFVLGFRSGRKPRGWKGWPRPSEDFSSPLKTWDLRIDYLRG